MKLLSWVASAGLAVSCAALPALGKVYFSFDYSLDAGGVFDASTTNGKAAQLAMDRAAQVFSDRLVDHLKAITPGSGDLWSPYISNPGTGLDLSVPLNAVGNNVIKIYVGSHTLSGTDVANTVIGTALPTGSPAFVENALSRGQAGALANPKTDFGPWGGSIAFDDATNWYFGASVSGLTANKVDFQTVAVHELEHLLGFSTSQASWAALVSGGKFTGPQATAANSGTAPNVSGSHWLGMSSTVGIGGASQIALMDSMVPTGVRRRITQLDWAALDDIAWDLAMPGDATADGVVDFLDFQAIELGYGETNSRWAHGDFNEDGTVDGIDFALLMKNYGKRSDGALLPPSPSEAEAIAAFASGNVPEPGATGLLMALSIAFLVRRRRIARCY